MFQEQLVKRLTAIALLSSTVLFSASNVIADTIRSIRVEGNYRIESETVESYIELNEGGAFNQDAIDQALKDLYATGYFTDVSIERENGTLIINLIENPMINKVAYEGNDKLSDAQLDEIVNLRPREVLSRSKILAAQRQILEVYRRLGRYGATVEPKFIKLDQNRVNLVFEINEGDVTNVREINFVGNESFSDNTLKKILMTKEEAWYRFFASDDIYDPDRLKADQEQLRQFYFESGYPDFRVVSAVAELSPDHKDFFITFTVDEGGLYSFGKVAVTSNIVKIEPKELDHFIAMSEGERFNSKLVDKTIENMAKHVASMGFAFVDIKPKVFKNPQTKTVDIVFSVDEGPRVYVERIEIIGNDRTRDYVIRREISIHEGDAFNVVKLQRAERSIRNLGYFDKVQVTIEPGSAPDRAKIIIQVEERSTGEFALAGGYSSIDGPLGTVRFSEQNFMGKGLIIDTSVTIASKRRSFTVGMTEPYFLGKKLSLGGSIFHSFNARIDSYEQTATGFNVHTGYDLLDDLQQKWIYTLKTDRIVPDSRDSSILIQQQKGSSITSSLTHRLVYDRRDNAIQPKFGYVLSLTNEWAGLGGDIHFASNKAAGAYYYTILDDVTFTFRGSAGRMDKIGRKDIRVADSFFLGATSFRGFAYGGIGPHDAVSEDRDALGGTKYWIGTVEARFPVGLPNEFNMKGVVFTEFGSVWDPGTKSRKTLHPTGGDPIEHVFNSNSVRWTCGVGLSWISPFGPLRIDFGFPIEKAKLDKAQVFTIGFQTRF